MPEETKPKFIAPVIADNPTGWGPCEVPDKYKDLPFQPFSKGDRIGKVADWTGTLYSERRYGGRYPGAQGSQYAPVSGTLQPGSQYAYYHEEQDASFQLVDTSRVQRTAQQKASRVRQMQIQRKIAMQKEREKRIQNASSASTMQGSGKGARNREKDRQKAIRRLQKQFGQRQKFDQKGQVQIKIRTPSVAIKPEWEVLEEIEFPRLQKLRLPGIQEGEDLECYGSMEQYERSYDRVSSKSEKPLTRVPRDYFSVTTTDDPVIQKLAKTPEYTVFGTDSIVAALMCCTKSVYSWDIVAHRVGKNKLFFDKRDQSEFDLLTVSETAKEPPQDEDRSLNSAKNLALEATFINRNFSQQVLRMGEERYCFKNPNIFADEECDQQELASVGYRYRLFDLGADIRLVCRCEHDAVSTGPHGETQFLTIKAFNEWDSRYSGGVDWRSKIDAQPGAVLGTELRNNSCKLAKWTIQALLAGSDFIKFGYVSRAHVKDSSKHVIIGVSQFKPSELASQISLSLDNAWGILRCLIELLMKMAAGKYLIMKDPNKALIRIYRLPLGTFEDEDEEPEADDDYDDDGP